MGYRLQYDPAGAAGAYTALGHPLVWQAPEFGIPLWAVYLTWVLVVTALYWPCRWFGSYKRANRQWWLSYL